MTWTYVIIAALILAGNAAWLRTLYLERKRSNERLRHWNPHPRAGWGNDGIEP